MSTMHDTSPRGTAPARLTKTEHARRYVLAALVAGYPVPRQADVEAAVGLASKGGNYAYSKLMHAGAIGKHVPAGKRWVDVEVCRRLLAEVDQTAGTI